MASHASCCRRLCHRCGSRCLFTEILACSSSWASSFLGTLGYLLARSKTGFRQTDSVINQLIRGAIQTGLFAGIFSLGDLITFAKLPETNFYGMFAIPIGRIYTNVSAVSCMTIQARLIYGFSQTLLDTLLSRRGLRQQLNGTFVDVDVPVGHISPRNTLVFHSILSPTLPSCLKTDIPP